MSIHLVFPMLGPLPFLWCYFFKFLWLSCILLLLSFFILWWFQLSFFLIIVLPLGVGHPCCLSLCWLDLFLKEYLLWYLSSLECVIMWSHSLATSNTILLVFHLVYEVPRNISDFHDLSRFQMFLMHLVSTVSTWLEPLLLLVASCYRFHSFFLLVALFLIKMLLVSTFHPVPRIALLL